MHLTRFRLVEKQSATVRTHTCALSWTSPFKDKLTNANKCLYVKRSLRKEGCSQHEVDYLFKAIVLPSVTYALVVCGASEPELTTGQAFLDRYHKRQYISVRLNIRELTERQDQKAFKKISQLSTHPLHEQVPKTKVIN